MLIVGLVVLTVPAGHGHASAIDPRLDNLCAVVGAVAAGKVTGRIVHIGPKDATGQLCWHVNNMLDQDRKSVV
jgi:hypothetical protein